MKHDKGRTLPPPPTISRRDVPAPPLPRRAAAPSTPSPPNKPNPADLPAPPFRPPSATPKTPTASHATTGAPAPVDDEFLDIITSSHAALKLDPKVLEDADDDFADEADTRVHTPAAAPSPALARPDLGTDDFFNVTDDDEDEVTAVHDGPAPAPDAARSATPSPAPTSAEEGSGMIMLDETGDAGLADLLEPDPSSATQPLPRAPHSSVPDLEIAAGRAEAQATATPPSTPPRPAVPATAPPRRSGGLLFAGGIGVGLAAGVAAALMLAPRLGAERPSGDSEAVAAAGVTPNATRDAAAPCPDPGAHAAPVAAPDETDPAAEMAKPDESLLADAAAPLDAEVDDEADGQAPGDPVGELPADASPLEVARTKLRADPAEALSLAEAANEKDRTNEGFEIIALANCELGDGPAARKAYRAVRFKEPRNRVTDRCVELGVQIYAKTLERTSKELLADAFAAYAEGDPEEAEDLALKSFKKHRTGEALILVGMVACDGHDDDKANRYARRLFGEDLDRLTAHCAEKSVVIDPPKDGGSSPGKSGGSDGSDATDEPDEPEPSQADDAKADSDTDE